MAATATKILFVPDCPPNTISRGDRHIGKGWAEANLGTGCIPAAVIYGNWPRWGWFVAVTWL